MTKKTVSVFGSTGSVGKSTVALLAAHKDRYDVKVLSANQNAQLLAEQAILLNAEYAVIADESKYEELKELLKNTSIKVLAGRGYLLDMASLSVDWVMMSIVGMAGLEPIFNALPNGNIVAIANKEPLVSAGELLMSRAKEYGTTILPVDSEHNAIFQVFEKDNRDSIDRIILTASGGPFRTWSKEEIDIATPEQAVAHPNWTMGAKISVDSASMMNKGLEIIEAHHLFDMPSDKIDVMVHPQSIIHSMVEYCDGSVLAQMGAPDMTTPIVNVLGYPERIATCGKKLDFKSFSELTFEDVDRDRFPAIQMSYDALEMGGASPIILNAANEVAVEAFLAKRIRFCGIVELIGELLNKSYNQNISSLEDILILDQTVRKDCYEILKKSSLLSQKVA